MELTKLSADVSQISKLGDYPKTDNNLTTNQLKAWFDKAPEAIKEYLNETLTVELEEKLTAMDERADSLEDSIEGIETGTAFVKKTGDTMTGALNVLTPTEGANAANKAYVDGKTAKGTATLTASGWSDGYQTVAVTGVTADNSVFVSVPESSYEVYTDAEIRCVEQSAGKLKFKCESAPSDDIAVDILIIN